MPKKTPEKKPKKKSDKPKSSSASKSPELPEGTMTHLQVINVERKLTQKEVAECGTNLATQELQLDQVRKEKKEANREFDNTIKDHLKNIMQFSHAIDTGILVENIECDVVINREKETKYCYPKDGSEMITLKMTPEDFDLLS